MTAFSSPGLCLLGTCPCLAGQDDPPPASGTALLPLPRARTCGRPGCELGVEVEGVLRPAHRGLEGRCDLLPEQLLQKQDGPRGRRGAEGAGVAAALGTAPRGGRAQSALPVTPRVL